MLKKERSLGKGIGSEVRASGSPPSGATGDRGEGRVGDRSAAQKPVACYSHNRVEVRVHV